MNIRRSRILGKHDKDARLRWLAVTLTGPQYLWVYDEAKRLKKPLAAILRNCVLHTMNCAKAPNNALPKEEKEE